jgi:hypothetical protein
VRHIDADHASCRTDLARRQQAIKAGTAAEIDHNLAGFHGRNGEGIAAAKAKICTVRHGRKFFVGIADITCLRVQVAGWRGRVATRCRRDRRAA